MVMAGQKRQFCQQSHTTTVTNWGPAVQLVRAVKEQAYKSPKEWNFRSRDKSYYFFSHLFQLKGQPEYQLQI